MAASSSRRRNRRSSSSTRLSCSLTREAAASNCRRRPSTRLILCASLSTSPAPELEVDETVDVSEEASAVAAAAAVIEEDVCVAVALGTSIMDMRPRFFAACTDRAIASRGACAECEDEGPPPCRSWGTAPAAEKDVVDAWREDDVLRCACSSAACISRTRARAVDASAIFCFSTWSFFSPVACARESSAASRLP